MTLRQFLSSVVVGVVAGLIADKIRDHLEATKRA